MYVSILEREDRVKGVGERRKGRKERKETRGGTEKKRDTRKEDKCDGRREKTTPLPPSYCSEQY
jgi:hypothetical protein